MNKMTVGMKMRRRVGNTTYHILMILLSLTMIYPFVWAILSSFKTPEQLYNGSPLDMLPQPFTLDGIYDRLFEVLPFWTVHHQFNIFIPCNSSLYDRGGAPLQPMRLQD